jgi:hypothetical protein
MKKWILILMAVAGFTGCDVDQRSPQEVKSSSNPDYRIALLFTHDGCRVYRFEDHYYERYFSDCRGSIESTVMHGKVSIPESTLNGGRR